MCCWDGSLIAYLGQPSTRFVLGAYAEGKSIVTNSLESGFVVTLSLLFFLVSLCPLVVEINRVTAMYSIL